LGYSQCCGFVESVLVASVTWAILLPPRLCLLFCLIAKLREGNRLAGAGLDHEQVECAEHTHDHTSTHCLPSRCNCLMLGYRTHTTPTQYFPCSIIQCLNYSQLLSASLFLHSLLSLSPPQAQAPEYAYASTRKSAACALVQASAR